MNYQNAGSAISQRKASA